MSSELYREKVQEIRGLIPAGVYRKGDRDLYCQVVGHGIDAKTKKVLIFHRRLSDNYQAVWALDVKEFAHLYQPVEDYNDSSLAMVLNEACTITVKQYTGEIPYNLIENSSLTMKDGYQIYKFKDPGDASDFVAYLEERGIHFE